MAIIMSKCSTSGQFMYKNGGDHEKTCELVSWGHKIKTCCQN